MAERKITYTIKPFIQGGRVADAEDVAIMLPNVSNDNVRDYLSTIQQQLATLSSSSFISGRPFVSFNDGFIIDDTNIDGFEDRNLIYTPKIDRVSDVFLPSDSDIAASNILYPVVFEFTHLGGSARMQSNNLVRLVVADGTAGTTNDTVSVLRRDDVVIVIRTGAGENWVETRSRFDPSVVLLPSGVFNLQNIVIDNIDNVETALSVETIEAGDGYLVEIGGSRFGSTIANRSVIVALVDSPSLLVDSVDWLVIENGTGSITNDQVLLLNQFARDGNRFDASRNVFVNPSNVVMEVNQAAADTPHTLTVFTPNSPTERIDVLSPSIPLTFTQLAGGQLTLEYSLSGASSGFGPEFREIILDYGSGAVFTFNIRGRGTNALETISTTAPNLDYTNALNSNCTVSIRYIERGLQFAGTLTIFSLSNVRTGTLYQPILDLINTAFLREDRRLQSEIDSTSTALSAIRGRIGILEELENNPVLRLSAELVSVLLNEIAISEQTDVTRVPSPLNLSLGGGTDPGLIPQMDPVVANAPAGRIGRAVFYRPGPVANNTILLSASDGDTSTNLLSVINGNLIARQRVPAVPSGNSIRTHYPAPANSFGGPGRWFLMRLEIDHTTAVAVSQTFAADLPTTETTVTIQAQILANGRNFDFSSNTILAGGNTDRNIQFNEVQGNETITVEVDYLATTRVIRVRATPSIPSGSLALDDLQVRFEWTESVTTAGTPETVRDVSLGTADDDIQVWGVKVANGNVSVVSRSLEIDTGYVANDVLNDGLSGSFISDMSTVFDANFLPNASSMTTLFANRNNVLFGLFVNNYTHETLVALATQLSVLNATGTALNVGDVLTDLQTRVTALEA